MNIIIIPAFFRTRNRPTLGSFFWDQALALRKAGHNVVILYSDTYSVKCVGEYLTYTERTKEQSDGIAIYRGKVFCPLKHGIEGHRESFAKCILRLYGQYEADGGVCPDIIHAHCSVWAGYAAMRLSEALKIPYIVTEHATLFELHKEQISRTNHQIIQQIFESAARVICVSRAFGKHIAAYRHTNDIEIIGNVVDCEQFVPVSVQPHAGMRFLTVCYMQTEEQLYKKGIDILLRAWAEIVHIFPQAQLVIGGGGPAVTKVEAWCRKYCVTDSVTLTGKLDRSQVVAAMQQCDCFVLPSRYETFGVVYIEAMACGKPVIASANGGPDDFVTDANGILIPPGEEGCLQKAISQVCRHQVQYSAQEIRASVQNKFSAEAIAEQLQQVYNKVKVKG